MAAATCPKCGTIDVALHCPNGKCGLIICKSGCGFGKPDGSRWAAEARR